MTEREYLDYLCHYGVKGMKWGHRKAVDTSSGSKPKHGSEEYYRMKAGKAVSKMESSKTRLGKSIRNNQAYINERKANVAAADAKAKNVLDRLDNRYGYGESVSRLNAAANFYDRKAGYAKTHYGKTQAETLAYNSRSMAKANNKIRNSDSLKSLGRNYMDKYSNRKIKTWSGRETTVGETYVDQLLSGGLGGLIEDIGYYRDSKRYAKQK